MKHHCTEEELRWLAKRYNFVVEEAPQEKETDEPDAEGNTVHKVRFHVVYRKKQEREGPG